MTNFEKIKNMTVKELASELVRLSNYVCGDYFNSCKECPLFRFLGNRDCNRAGFVDWLNSEVEE